MIAPTRTGIKRCALILAMGLVASTSQAQPEADAPVGPPPAKVRAGTASVEGLQDRVMLVGRLRESRRATASSERGGRVVEVSVEEGEPVVGGETVLARIDDVLERLEVASAEAQVQQAKAGVAEAQTEVESTLRNWNYLRELGATGAAPAKEVNDSEDEHAAAKARLESARADVRAAETRLDLTREQLRRSVVLAPFDGVVTWKLTEVGQWLQAGGPVAEVISRGHIDAQIDVPERLVNHVRQGDMIELHVEAVKAVVQGRVFAVIPTAATAARTFPVKIRFDDEDGRFKAGMSVVARVPTDEMRQVLTIPRDGVLWSGSASVVWAAENGVARPVPVRVLFGHQDRWAVEGLEKGGEPPIKPGTPVVIEGAERLSPGQAVTITDESAESASSKQ